VLSIGVFFTLMIVGLASQLPATMHAGLLAHGVPPADATRISHIPPVASLFAAFLGYNPMATLLGHHVLATLPPGQAQRLTSHSFFPTLISDPFHQALVYAFAFAIAACVIAAVASALRGGKYHHLEAVQAAPVEVTPPESAAARKAM
jgi:ABC-type lipoprotein release transport system permease subunit